LKKLHGDGRKKGWPAAGWKWKMTEKTWTCHTKGREEKKEKDDKVRVLSAGTAGGITAAKTGGQVFILVSILLARHPRQGPENKVGDQTLGMHGACLAMASM
jgi:hypothetical protein